MTGHWLVAVSAWPGRWLLEMTVGPWTVEPVVALAWVLLVAGVLASFVPVVPGGLLSLGGIVAYWSATGDPGWLVLSGVALLAILAVVADWFAGVLAAKAGGASTRTTVVATAVGILGLLLAGPFGFVIGTAATVFGLELRESGDTGHSARAAGTTLVGMLGSSVAQFLLTVSVLLVMVVVALL